MEEGQGASLGGGDDTAGEGSPHPAPTPDLFCLRPDLDVYRGFPGGGRQDDPARAGTTAR